MDCCPSELAAGTVAEAVGVSAGARLLKLRKWRGRPNERRIV